jgi:hypothetical protein
MAKKILLCGTTGSGKTTLLRILLGLDLNNPLSNFLATSASKTTTARLDVEITDGPYTALVQFLDESFIKLLLLESIERARAFILENKTHDQVGNALLEHPEQRFRLKYLLGDFTHSTKEEEINDGSKVKAKRQIVSREVDNLISLLYGDKTDEEIAQITFDLVKNKLKSLGIRTEEWPDTVNLVADDYKSFASGMKIYTGNHYTQFGKLLSPLVKYIWLRGPFTPTNYSEKSFPEWLFIDGEGLGHISRSTGALPSSLVDLLHEVDIILVVDNAAQPMQSGTQSLIRTAAILGLTEKLRLVFTHFDQVKGENLPTTSDKINHVISSLHNFLYEIEKEISPELAKSLRDHLIEAANFFSYIDNPKKALNPLSQKHLESLYTRFEQAPIVSPEHHPHSIVKAFITNQEIKRTIRDHAVIKFIEDETDNMGRTHWTQVKALARRFHSRIADEYKHMKPVTHLLQKIMETNYQWWVRRCGGNIGLANRIASDMSEVYKKNIREVLEGNFEDDWSSAFYEAGKGSHSRRVSIINSIYSDAFEDDDGVDNISIPS